MKLNIYISLIESFLKNEITATDFKREYFRLFKNDHTKWSEAEFGILNGLFGDIDSFCADSSLRVLYSLDETQLRKKCEAALSQLSIEVEGVA